MPISLIYNIIMFLWLSALGWQLIYLAPDTEGAI